MLLSRRSLLLGSPAILLGRRPANAAFAIFQTAGLYDNNLDFASFGGSPGASGAANSAALSSFNTAYAGLSGRTRIYIAPGTYTFSSQFNIANVPPPAGSVLVIDAYGVTITGPAGVLSVVANTAGIVQGADNAKETRIDTVGAGASTVVLKTAGETSRFSVGQYACVSGINMQGAGDPPNLGIFEIKKIQSIGVGTLTFTTPLAKSYKDTWPVYTAGRGGPAAVFPMQGAYDQEVEFKGATFTDSNNGTYGKTRVMQWTDCSFATYGPFPSVNKLFRATRCSANGFGGLEVDKVVERVEFLSCDIRAIDFQSASINELYVDAHTATNASGTPRFRAGACDSNVFNNVSIGTGGQFQFGPMNYGGMGPTVMTNVTAPNASWFGTTTPFSDYTEEGGGVLSYPGGPGAPSNTTHWWATPGANAVLVDASLAWARSFQVSDVSQSAGRTYITTNLPFPVPSTINGKSAPWKIGAHPCADLTMSGCTGNSLFTAQSALPAHTPFQNWTL